MKKKTVRTGIVGSGFSATFHFEALRKVYGTNVEVIGVHTLDVEGGKAYAEKRGIRFFETLDSLLDEVDVVHVCVPPVAHEPVSVAALRRDKFVICEKPLTGYFGDGTDGFHGDRFPKQDALDAALASVDRILEAERQSKGQLLYAENWVYAPAIQKEREIFAAQAETSGKPANIIEKMVDGRIRKYLAEITLVGQPFVKDPDQTVGQLLKSAGAVVIGFARMELGEGIEKKTENFADEVMAQVKGG